MKVKMLVGMAGPEVTRYRGQIYEVDSAEGRRLIEAAYAEPFTGALPTRETAAIQGAPQNAAHPPATMAATVPPAPPAPEKPLGKFRVLKACELLGEKRKKGDVLEFAAGLSDEQQKEIGAAVGKKLLEPVTE